MGMKGKEIANLNIKYLVDMLNRALAEEWLAYYQYWLGAKVAKGPMRPEVAAELAQHATEELKHADMLAERIIQLGGKPVLEPSAWSKLAKCQYAAPSDPHVKALLKQNIDGERCAIETYSELIALTKDKDELTYNMAVSILADEVEHEEDLENLLEDMEL